MAIKTELDLYKGLLFNLNKEEAPSFLIDDFNFFANKAENQYRNKKYSSYDAIQQRTDDLRNLSTSITINCTTGAVTNKFNESLGTVAIRTTVDGIAFDLPKDYFHLIGCIVNINTNKIDCDGNAIIRNSRATRLTADMEMSIAGDFFQKPTIDRVYHYIQGDTIELKFGKKGFIQDVRIEYLREPEPINLTPEQVNENIADNSIDNSKILSFSTYINYEILRELTSIVLAVFEDPKLNTLPIVTNSVQ